MTALNLPRPTAQNSPLGAAIDGWSVLIELILRAIDARRTLIASPPGTEIHRFFCNLFGDKPASDESITCFIERLIEYRTALAYTEEAIRDKAVLHRLLHVFPSSYTMLKWSILPTEALPFVRLCGRPGHWAWEITWIRTAIAGTI